MTNADRLALLLSMLAVLAASLVGSGVFENMAHLEDEFAYVWQAQAAARGDLKVPSPEYPSTFIVPFVVDYQGQRFGKYPPGWPVLLSFGVRLGARGWVNPLLAGLALWMVYRLGTRLGNALLGLLAAGLMLSSPFFLINSSTLLSHPWSLVLSLAFIHSWLEGMEKHGDAGSGLYWLSAISGGLALGLLGLTRPMTMVGVALPFMFHGLYLLYQGGSRRRKRVLLMGSIAVLLAAVHFLWQYALTGDFFRNPYTLWWPYDKVGFGPGHGVMEGGHNLNLAWWNTKHSLRTGLSDLFGWAKVSWLFLPFGLWALRKNTPALLVGCVFFSLVLVYGAYWVGAWLLGPRYYYPALPAMSVFSAAGILSLGGWSLEKGTSFLRSQKGWQRIRPLLTSAVALLLLTANLRFYLPSRLADLHGLYGIQREDLKPFTGQAAEGRDPALFLVHTERWMGYGTYLELTSPYFDTPYIFGWSIGPRKDRAVTEAFQDQRIVYHYYPEDPWVFYTTPHEGTY